MSIKQWILAEQMHYLSQVTHTLYNVKSLTAKSVILGGYELSLSPQCG